MGNLVEEFTTCLPGFLPGLVYIKRIITELVLWMPTISFFQECLPELVKLLNHILLTKKNYVHAMPTILARKCVFQKKI